MQLQLIAWLLGNLKIFGDFEALVEKSPRKLFPEKMKKCKFFFFEFFL
jgi:hypothetical protein